MPAAKKSKAAPMPTIGFEEIGPEEAYEILAQNTANRALRDRQVQKYARDMRVGRWELAGEPVEIAPDGTVINGQHRLYAIIEADVKVTLPVIRGLSMSAQSVVDQGVKRTFSDVLKLRYHAIDCNVLAAAVRQLYQYRATGIWACTTLIRLFSTD